LKSFCKSGSVVTPLKKHKELWTCTRRISNFLLLEKINKEKSEGKMRGKQKNYYNIFKEKDTSLRNQTLKFYLMCQNYLAEATY